MTTDHEWFDRPGGEPVEIHPADPTWRATAEAWMAAIRQALPVSDVAVDHIGSTAVPDLPAEPVIDLQLAVPDLVDDHVYRPALESLGLVLRRREPDRLFFRPPAGSPRTVHVHVGARGSDRERTHLAFRDSLTSGPEPARQ